MLLYSVQYTLVIHLYSINRLTSIVEILYEFFVGNIVPFCLSS